MRLMRAIATLSAISGNFPTYGRLAASQPVRDLGDRRPFLSFFINVRSVSFRKVCIVQSLFSTARESSGRDMPPYGPPRLGLTFALAG